jgi:hypothetical protein
MQELRSRLEGGFRVCLLVDARMGDAGVMSVHYCIIRWVPAFTGLKMTVPLFVEGSS